ncbi:MAG: hypothetical protein N2691_02915 [Patescibacteria group bacterium]|nr:hypothetical protein [Patescibacteria group bacterium]
MTEPTRKTVAVFCGSDYCPNRALYADIAFSTGRLLAERGYDVVTGGGLGMMSDVNKGAVHAGAKRVVSIRYCFNEGIQSPFFTEFETFNNLIDRQLMKPVVFVGDRFYQPIKEFIEMVIPEGFLSIPLDSLCDFTPTPEAAVTRIGNRLQNGIT